MKTSLGGWAQVTGFKDIITHFTQAKTTYENFIRPQHLSPRCTCMCTGVYVQDQEIKNRNSKTESG